MRRICGDEVADQCKRIWGLDKEGELNGCWRDVGIPNMWFMMGRSLCPCLPTSLNSRRPARKAIWRCAGSIPSISRCVSAYLSALLPEIDEVQFVFVIAEIKAMEEGVFGTRYSMDPQ